MSQFQGSASVRKTLTSLTAIQADTTNIREFDRLPTEAKKYINRLEELIDCPANIVCVGPAREQTIEVRPVL